MRKLKVFFVTVTLIVVFVAVNGSVWAEASDKININTATAEELVQLKKIGPKTANKIIEYRETTTINKTNIKMKTVFRVCFNISTLKFNKNKNKTKIQAKTKIIWPSKMI